MSTYSETVFNFTTTTVRGVTVPMKYGGDIGFRVWSGFPDDMDKQIKYLQEEFEVREDDVYICTYPRSGTNWVHEIVQMLLQGTTEFAPMFGFLDVLTDEELKKLRSPRVICTHLPFKYLPPKMMDCKVICPFRNPKDVAVSWHNFNFHVNFMEYDATFCDYLELFLDGEVEFRTPRENGVAIPFYNCKVPCGTWFDHVLDWEKVIQQHKDASILTLMYEDMKCCLLDSIKRIDGFLGVSRNPELLSEIAKKCEFKVQYKERTTNVPEIIQRITKNTPNFLYRKGEVGDWKNYFTVAQNEQFDGIYKERMKNSSLKFKFSIKS